MQPKLLSEDLSCEDWRNREYEVRYESVCFGNPNWFAIEEFIELVDLRLRP